MSNTSLSVVALDFATLRNSLKNYLKSQQRFKDYDFDGSNMSVLLDILSYNSYHNAFYLNMVATEMFLDSAELRDSIISHAKELNYVPRSSTSATANVSIKITTSDGTKGIIIPKYTTFTGRIGSNTFTFSTNSAYFVTSDTNEIYANNIPLYEGVLTNDQFVVGNDLQKFVLSNPSIDTTSLFVTVIEDSGSVTFNYKKATSLFDLNANSEVFFLQATTDDKYEIVFGDGVSGRKPKHGAVININYRISSGDDANSIRSLSVDGPISGQSNVAIVVNGSTQGGSPAETSESIRLNAPRHFTTQERAVTAEDYETLLLSTFPEISTVSAVGGEELSPPQFGKVSIAVALNNVDGLPDSKREQYTKYIKSRSPLGIDPIFTVPDYMYVSVNSNIKYNINTTSQDPAFIRTLVVASLDAYNKSFLNKFKSTLKYSQLVRVIDATDTSIISNDTSLRMIKRLNVNLATNSQYYVNFQQPISSIISNNTYGITSSPFVYRGQTVILRDDGLGNIFVVLNSIESQSILFKIGSVDYQKGDIKISNLTIDSINTRYFKIFATPINKDIFSTKDIVLSIDLDETQVNVIPGVG